MAKADRLERFDLHRIELENDYATTLKAALEMAAGGKWGLFDHHADRNARGRFAPVVGALLALADEINDLRVRLGLQCFALHVEFLASRGAVASSAPGEPRQAQAWLNRWGNLTSPSVTITDCGRCSG